MFIHRTVQSKNVWFSNGWDQYTIPKLDKVCHFKYAHVRFSDPHSFFSTGAHVDKHLVFGKDPLHRCHDSAQIPPYVECRICHSIFNRVRKQGKKFVVFNLNQKNICTVVICIHFLIFESHPVAEQFLNRLCINAIVP